MPVEIRELVIKTEISSAKQSENAVLTEEQLNLLKEKIVAECLEYIKLSDTSNIIER